MNSKLRMFLFLVGIGFTSSMLLSLIPWGHFAECAQDGMVPDLSSDVPKCIEFGVPNAFGDELTSEYSELESPHSPVPEPEPEQDITVYENCGEGTTLEDGICVVDEIEKQNSDSTRWGSIGQHVASPLKQFQEGIPFSEIKCDSSLQLTQRYDGSPACVKSDTYWELIKRDWVSNMIKAIQSRDASSSYMDSAIPTLDDFRNTLKESSDIDAIFSKFGDPHDDIGSGIHIYEYVLNDSTKVWIGYADVIQYVKHVDTEGKILEDLYLNLIKEPKSEPHPEPALIPEEELLQKQRKHEAKLRTHETIMIDYRGYQHRIDAINQYRQEFESGYFLEQFVIPNKQNFEAGQVINFVVVQWGYQPDKCISYSVKGYFKSYSNYENPFNIEKISEYENTAECDSVLDSDSNGYLIFSIQPMTGISEEHQTCENPGEYRIHVRNLENMPQMESGYYTCQRDKLVGEPQPWMHLPE